MTEVVFLVKIDTIQIYHVLFTLTRDKVILLWIGNLKEAYISNERYEKDCLNLPVPALQHQ